jgi:transketolase
MGTADTARRTDASYESVRELFELTSGDEKHDPSSRSILDVVWVLYDRVLRHDPADPRSEDRDRLIVSKGHGPLALYAVLAARGFFPQEELSTFLAWGSRLGGHPDRHKVPGVEASTGSLGHGVPMAVGVALALRAKASDRRVFVLMGDGECSEGSVWESLLLAGSLGLERLTGIVIDNDTSSRPLGDLVAKLEAFGWAAVRAPARDHAALEVGLRALTPGRPTALVVEWRAEGS